MKNIFTILSFLLFLLFQNLVFSQVKEKVYYMSDGEQTAFHFEMETNNVKGIEKLWKKYFKDYGKIKKNSKAKEWQTKKPVNIPTTGNIEYDIYFKLTKKNDVLSAYMWAYNGEEYVTSENNAEQANKLKTMFEGFAYKTEVFIIESILDEEEDELNYLEKDLSKLEKKNDKYHRKIENAKLEIIENEENIEQNIILQKKKNEEIDAQRKRVQKVKDNLNKL